MNELQETEKEVISIDTKYGQRNTTNFEVSVPSDTFLKQLSLYTSESCLNLKLSSYIVTYMLMNNLFCNRTVCAKYGYCV